MSSYVRRSLITSVRVALLYKPLRVFSAMALLIALPGIAAIARFVYFCFTDGGQGHIQSLAVAGALICVAAIVRVGVRVGGRVGGLRADLIAANRMMLEEIRTRQLRDVGFSRRPAF